MFENSERYIFFSDCTPAINNFQQSSFHVIKSWGSKSHPDGTVIDLKHFAKRLLKRCLIEKYYRNYDFALFQFALYLQCGLLRYDVVFNLKYSCRDENSFF